MSDIDLPDSCKELVLPRVRLEPRGSDRRPWQEAVGMVVVPGMIAEAERADRFQRY